jgi:hypothetical protein
MATDEEQIRQLLATQQQAVCAKDVDRIMAHYDETSSSSTSNLRFKSEERTIGVASGKRRCLTSPLRSATR